MAEDLGAVVGRIMEHPELVGQIAELLKNAPPVSNSEGEKTVAEASAPSQNPSMPPGEVGEAVATLGNLFGRLGKIGFISHGGGDNRRRMRYLQGMKAFVNPRRAATIDSMILILRLLSIGDGKP